MSQNIFYQSVVAIKTTNGVIFPLPCYPGVRLTVPRNYAVPTPIGNAYQVNFCQGQRQPFLDVSLAVRDEPGEVLALSGNYFNPSFLDYIFTRGSLSGLINLNDTVFIGTIYLFDGVRLFAMDKAKVEAAAWSVMKGDLIQMNVRFTGSNTHLVNFKDSDYIDFSSFIGWDNATLLGFQSVSVNDSNGIFFNTPWKVTWSFQNNHYPDTNLSGTGFPFECHAGTPIARLAITVQGGDPWIDNQNFQNQPAYINVNILGINGQCTFSFLNAVDNTPEGMMIDIPRTLHTHEYICLGQTQGNNAIAPVFISSSY